MKIYPTEKTVAPAAVPEERTRTPQPATGEPSAKPRAEVQLSPLATQLREIEAKLDTETAVDTARVAEIKRAMAEGRFEVDSSKVADKLLQGTRDLLSSQKPSA